MKKLKLAAKLLLFVLLAGIIAFLLTVINKPVQQASAVALDNQIDPCQVENPPAECNQTRCTDPDVDGCLPGCSLNNDEVCVPDPSPTPPPATPPQVLGLSTTADPTTGGK